MTLTRVVPVFLCGNLTFLSHDFFSSTLTTRLVFQAVEQKFSKSLRKTKVFCKKWLERYANLISSIDYGSHINQHQIESFKTLFPFLKDGGIYIVEDIQTFYRPSFGGGNLKTEEYEKSCIRFFLGLVDGLNYGEYLDESFFSS